MTWRDGGYVFHERNGPTDLGTLRASRQRADQLGTSNAIYDSRWKPPTDTYQYGTTEEK